MTRKKQRKLRNLTDIFLCDKTLKNNRAPRWRLGRRWFYSRDRRGCQLTIQPAFEHADSAYFVFTTDFVFSCLFLHFGRMPLSSFFVKFVAGLATKSNGKEKLWSRKGGFNKTKKDGDPHPQRTWTWTRTRRSVASLRVSGFSSLLVFGVPGKKEKVF